ncbi:MAG: hypothetical protein CMP11_08595 [Zetaproteobacteria bacterium]|nr:hypothetical protein [Pseudobdellovibrionaceae bacterium]
MDRSSIIGIIVCVIFYITYENYLTQKYPNRFKTNLQQTEHSEAPPPSEQNDNEKNFDIKESESDFRSDVALVSEEELTVENEDVRYTFNQKTGGLDSVILKSFKDDSQTSTYSLLDSPLTFYASSNKNFKNPNSNYEVRRSDGQLSFYRNEGPWKIEHRFRVDKKGFGVDIDFFWTNVGEKPLRLVSHFFLKEELLLKEVSSSFMPGVSSARQSFVVMNNGEADRLDFKESCKKDSTKPLFSGQKGHLNFLGFDNHYFLRALLPQAEKVNFSIQNLGTENSDSCAYLITNNFDQGLVQPMGTMKMSFKSWFGPKTASLMKAYDPVLESTLDLGFFSKISMILFSALEFVYSFVENWGIAIIIVTLLLKVLFYPLTRRAAISMARMKTLQPEMNKIKEKYKDDMKMQQQETMRFMQEKKINPLKGCLPFLVQIPIFIAYFRVLSTSIELRQAPFAGWIHDLSIADPFYVLPVLCGLCFVLQQKLTPTTSMDKIQERMMMIMPIMFSFMMVTLPAGLVLYMLANSLVSIVQQQWINKKIAMNPELA